MKNIICILVLSVFTAACSSRSNTVEENSAKRQQYTFNDELAKLEGISVPLFELVVSTEQDSDLLLAKDTSGFVFCAADYAHLIERSEDASQVIDLRLLEDNSVEIYVAEVQSTPPYYDEHTARNLIVSYTDILTAYEKSMR